MPTSHYAFRALPFLEQIQIVWDEGQHLATRYEEENTVGLYHMEGGFFVELFYDHVANVLHQQLRTFISTACLESYAAYIKLDDLPLE